MPVCAFLTATPALTPLLKPAMAAAADTAAAEPAATCLSAITRADGRLAKRRVEVGSGDRAADRRAPAHLDMLDLSRSIRDLEPERQSGYIVVWRAAPNAFPLGFSDQRGLHASCEAACAAASGKDRGGRYARLAAVPAGRAARSRLALVGGREDRRKVGGRRMLMIATAVSAFAAVVDCSERRVRGGVRAVRAAIGLAVVDQAAAAIAPAAALGIRLRHHHRSAVVRRRGSRIAPCSRMTAARPGMTDVAQRECGHGLRALR